MLNQIKTLILLAILSAILIWIGSLFGINGLIVGLVIALVINLISFFLSDKIALAMYKAKEIKKNQNPELFLLVEEVSKKAGIPMPRIFIIPSEQPNAFATGRSPKKSVIAFTSGILKILDKNELLGVIAHEISHIKNRDILIQTIASIIASIIAFIAMFARYAALAGGIREDGERGSAIELLVLAILTPIIATLIQLSISRTREYMADKSAAHTLKDSSGLASALQKLDLASKNVPMKFGSKTTECLFIVNPFSREALISLFSTHPPISRRIKLLKEMKF